MLSSFFVPKYAIKAASCHASREAASGRFGWWQVLWIGVLHLKKAILEAIDSVVQQNVPVLNKIRHIVK